MQLLVEVDVGVTVLDRRGSFGICRLCVVGCVKELTLEGSLVKRICPMLVRQ